MRAKKRKIEFPDRQAYRRRQRSGALTAVCVVGVAVLLWGGYRLYRHTARPPARSVAPLPKPVPKPVPPPVKPPDPIMTRAARMAGIRDAMQRGDEVGMQKQVDLLQDDFRKSMRFVDATRVADYEAARREAWNVAGVRSLAWLDRVNLYAIIDSPAKRNQATIDAVCKAMHGLGENPDVIVALQVDFRGQQEIDLLSRNCRAAPAPAIEPAAPAIKPGDVAKPAAQGDGKDKADPAAAPPVPEDQDPVRENSLRILRDTTPEM